MERPSLSTPRKVVVGAAVLLFLATFMPWFKIHVFGQTTDATGWEVGLLWGRLPMLLGLLMLTHVLVSTYAADLTLPPWPWDRLHLAGGGLAAGLVVLRFIFGYEVRGFDYHRTFGIVIAMVAALGLAAGAYLAHRDARSDQLSP